MSEEKKVAKDQTPEVINRRTNLNRVIIDTPALLNMVKHCREVEAGAAHGYLMGVMQACKDGKDDGKSDENLVFQQDTLRVTQSIPKASKIQMHGGLFTTEVER
jgi:hypothetical protein